MRESELNEREKRKISKRIKNIDPSGKWRWRRCRQQQLKASKNNWHNARRECSSTENENGKVNDTKMVSIIHMRHIHIISDFYFHRRHTYSTRLPRVFFLLLLFSLSWKENWGSDVPYVCFNSKRAKSIPNEASVWYFVCGSFFYFSSSSNVNTENGFWADFSSNICFIWSPYFDISLNNLLCGARYNVSLIHFK